MHSILGFPVFYQHLGRSNVCIANPERPAKKDPTPGGLLVPQKFWSVNFSSSNLYFGPKYECVPSFVCPLTDVQPHCQKARPLCGLSGQDLR